MLNCDCRGRNQGFTAYHEKDSSGRPVPTSFNYQFWVCSNCLKPTRMVFDKLTDRYAPRRATRLVSVVAKDNGTKILTWATEVSGERIETMTYCPYPHQVDKEGRSLDHGRGILIELWKRLDYAIDQIRGMQTDLQLIELEKARANECADIIALVMKPFYEDRNAVLRESMTRWKARTENRDHESPGLAESIWDPNTRFDGTPYSRENEARVRAGVASKSTVKLDDQKITFIKHCLETGSQTPQVLASMFGCTIEDIKAAVE